MLSTSVFSREKRTVLRDSITTPTKVERGTSDYIITDSICYLSDRNNRMYDSLQAKSRHRAFPRILYQTFVTGSGGDTPLNGQVIDESLLFAPYKGRTIGNVVIERENVFNDDGNWLERAGNTLHATTRERVVRRDLLFRAGDKVDPQLLVRNKQLLRSRPYISDAWVVLVPNAEDSTQVDIYVRTRDSWTISANLGFGPEDRMNLELYDANLMGWGNRLSINTNLNWKNFDYGGNIVEYEIPNVLGSFYTAALSAGRDFYNSELKLALKKEFINPTDYEVGVEYNDIQSKYYRVDIDSTTVIKRRGTNIWSGYSHYIPGIESSIYLTGHYGYARYDTRPEVAATHNPIFHNFNRAIFGLGLYREKFYSANMVYGFGTREYLATGYQAEFLSGYSWEEFAERMYVGSRIKAGDFTGIGYIMGGVSLGSYIDPKDGSWYQSVVDMDMRWFSNLLTLRRSRLRQFLSLNYTQGWNRGTGSDELVSFTRTNGLRTLTEHITGTNRLVLNTESVLFTPIQPLGFRFAFFGFADFGSLGSNPNPFDNEFFASFGVGVRIKNERLIFSTVQIQLGFTVGKRGWLDSRYFNTSNETRMEKYRYLPKRPEVIQFK